MSVHQDHIIDRIKKLPAEIRLLIEKRIELYIIEFGEKLSQSASKAIAGLISGLVFAVAIIFGLVALSLFIGDMLESYAAGFGVVTVLLFVLALVVYLLSPDLIEHRIRDSIARSFLESDAKKTDVKTVGVVSSSKVSKDGHTDGSEYAEESTSGHTIKNINPN